MLVNSVISSFLLHGSLQITSSQSRSLSWLLIKEPNTSQTMRNDIFPSKPTLPSIPDFYLQNCLSSGPTNQRPVKQQRLSPLPPLTAHVTQISLLLSRSFTLTICSYLHQLLPMLYLQFKCQPEILPCIPPNLSRKSLQFFFFSNTGP